MEIDTVITRTYKKLCFHFASKWGSQYRYYLMMVKLKSSFKFTFNKRGR